MSAQYLGSWSPSARISAHTALVALLDSDTNAAYITIHTSDDTLLATIPLGDPCGAVDAVTGVLTLTPVGREEGAPNNGVASYASLRDGSDAVHSSLECVEGISAVTNRCVLNSLTVVSGSPLELVSWTVV